jgi:heme/copper-type cytochrome/quinol oxidase subunit 2
MRHCADGGRRRWDETQLKSREKGEVMHAWMDGWDWFWMTLMMGFWVVVLGAVIYIAVRLAQRPPTKPRADS